MHIYTRSYKIYIVLLASLLMAPALLAQRKSTIPAPLKQPKAIISKKDTSSTPDKPHVSRLNDKGLTATGTITDNSTGKPISGISVSVADFSAAITDEKGSFVINVPAYSAVLIVSGQGYQTKELPG